MSTDKTISSLYDKNKVEIKIAPKQLLKNNALISTEDLATKTELSDEATARENADTALQSAIDEKASIEAINSLGKQVDGLTTGLAGRLYTDGSNATIKTPYNVLNSAAGGANLEYDENEEIVTTHPTGSTAYKRTLGKFLNWILDKVKTLIHNRKIQESAITFHKQNTDFIPFGIEIPSTGLYGNFIDANIIVTSTDAATLRGYSFKLTIIPQIWGDGKFRTSGNDTNYKTSMKVLGTANMKDLLGYKLVTFTNKNDNKIYLGLRVSPKYCIPTSAGTSIMYNLKSEIETSNNLTIKFFDGRNSDISNFDLISTIEFPNSSHTTYANASIETIQTNNLYDSARGNNTAYSLNPWVKYNGPAIKLNHLDFTITINTNELIPGMCYSLKPHRRDGVMWSDDYAITLAFVNSSSETCTIYGGCENGIGIVPSGTTIGKDENKTTLFTITAKNNPNIELYVRTSSSGAKNIYIFGY